MKNEKHSLSNIKSLLNQWKSVLTDENSGLIYVKVKLSNKENKKINLKLKAKLMEIVTKLIDLSNKEIENILSLLKYINNQEKNGVFLVSQGLINKIELVKENFNKIMLNINKAFDWNVNFGKDDEKDVDLNRKLKENSHKSNEAKEDKENKVKSQVKSEFTLKKTIKNEENQEKPGKSYKNNEEEGQFRDIKRELNYIKDYILSLDKKYSFILLHDQDRESDKTTITRLKNDYDKLQSDVKIMNNEMDNLLKVISSYEERVACLEEKNYQLLTQNKSLEKILRLTKNDMKDVNLNEETKGKVGRSIVKEREDSIRSNSRRRVLLNRSQYDNDNDDYNHQSFNNNMTSSSLLTNKPLQNHKKERVLLKKK